VKAEPEIMVQNESEAGGGTLPEATEERELMASAAEGDRAAFASIVQKHQGAVYGFVRARLLQDSDAEDLTQEVFVRCYEGIDRFDASANLRPWLFGIARNLLREHLRRGKRRKEVAWTGLCLELEEVVTPEEDRHDEALEHLPNCMDGLGENAKTALRLHYRAKMRLAKIGERLRRSEGAVKLLMFRARQALRACLGGKMDPEDWRALEHARERRASGPSTRPECSEG